jgi:hypothetical protein
VGKFPISNLGDDAFADELTPYPGKNFLERIKELLFSWRDEKTNKWKSIFFRIKKDKTILYKLPHLGNVHLHFIIRKPEGNTAIQLRLIRTIENTKDGRTKSHQVVWETIWVSKDDIDRWGKWLVDNCPVLADIFIDLLDRGASLRTLSQLKADGWHPMPDLNDIVKKHERNGKLKLGQNELEEWVKMPPADEPIILVPNPPENPEIPAVAALMHGITWADLAKGIEKLPSEPLPVTADWGARFADSLLRWFSRQAKDAGFGPLYFVFDCMAFGKTGARLIEWLFNGAQAGFEDLQVKHFFKELGTALQRKLNGEPVDWKEILGFDPMTIFLPDPDPKPPDDPPADLPPPAAGQGPAA